MDPYFDVAASDVRGFDLGDDAELLAELHGRRVAAPDRLSGDDWMLLGILSHRAGDDGEAARCFERAAQAGHTPARARYLLAQLKLDAGKADEAEVQLELAEDANQNSSDLPDAELAHARGSMLLLQGEQGEALAAYMLGLEMDPTSAPRWVATARLLVDLERWEEGLRAAKRALEEDPDSLDALYLVAACSARTGDTAACLTELARALKREAALGPRARRDPCFAPLHSDATFTSLTAPPSPPDLEWLDAFPPWLGHLRRDPQLGGLGLRWLDEEESLRRTEAWAEAYARRGPTGTLHTEATLALARKQLQGRRIVAQGPSTRRREGTDEPSFVLIDVRRPDTLWIALSEAYPPFLWLEGGTTAASLSMALSEYFPQPDRSRRQLTRVARGFMGYRLQFGVPSPVSGEIEPANALELDHHFTLSPFLETASWGSAYADDPWPAVIPSQPDFEAKFSERQRKVAEQAPGAVWAVTRRTRHSRSYFTVELHHRDIFVLEVRYCPARQEGLVARLNEHFGCDYPLDVPPDAIGALLGFRFDSASDLLAQTDATARPEEIAGLLTVASALRHSDAAMVRIYRRYMDHPDPVVRTTLCNVFSAYNFESLLEEMTVLEPDPEIASQLEALLDRGIPMTQLDPYTDYGTEDEREAAG